MKNASIEDLYEALSDNKALVLFNAIALYIRWYQRSSDSNPKDATGQYYCRLTRLIWADLIRRLNGRYSLTLLGKMIYDIHVKTSRVLSYHWKSKAIESVQISSSTGIKLPEEEFSVVDTLIDDSKIKNMVQEHWRLLL
jgi:hypothetical protein